jgi:hypothetical protein
MLIRAAWQRRMEAAAEVNPSTYTSPCWLVKGTVGLPIHTHTHTHTHTPTHPRNMSEWPRATAKSNRLPNVVRLKLESNNVLKTTAKNGLLIGWRLLAFIKIHFNLRSSLFWHAMRCRLAVGYRRSETADLSHIQECSWMMGHWRRFW